MPDDLILPGRTITGRGAIQTMAEQAAAFGRRGLLVHSASLRAAGFLRLLMQKCPAGITIVTAEHPGGEPKLDHLAALLATARRERADWVAAVGGGSVMDVAKACAGLLHAAGALEEYHDGRPVECPGAPFIAAPTTAGTGSEATMNAVLTNPRTGQKKSIRHPCMMARLVILDAALLDACPPAIRAHAGLDALTQAIEAFVCRAASRLSDDFARRSFRLLAASLLDFGLADTGEATPPEDPAEKMLLGSYFSGLALSIARLGVVHGIAHPLGARYKIPHGQVCGLCLPLALELNRAAMGERYAELSALAGADLRQWVESLLSRLAVQNPFPSLQLRDTDGIIRETLASASARANPRPVTADDVRWLLARLFTPLECGGSTPLMAEGQRHRGAEGQSVRCSVC